MKKNYDKVFEFLYTFIAGFLFACGIFVWADGGTVSALVCGVATIIALHLSDREAHK